MSFSPERKAFVFLSIGLVFALALGFMSFVSTKSSLETEKREKHTFEVISKIKRVSLAINTMQGEVRGYLITGDESLLEDYKAARDDYSKSVNELENLVSDENGQEGRIEAVKKLAVDRVAVLNKSIELKKSGIVRASQVSEGERVNREINGLIDDMLSDEKSSFGKRQTRHELRAHHALWLILTATASSVILVLSAIMIIRRDYERRKRLERVINKNSSELEDLYDNAPCGYYSIDKDGLFVRMNDTALKWLGYAREDVVGKLHVFEIMTQQSLKVFEENFSRFKERGYAQDIELEFMRGDGSVIPVLLNATTIKDDNGNFLMSRTTFFDITEARKARSELMEKNRELNDALSKVKLLSGLLPICASCKKIRDDDGYWNSVEKYIGEHSEAAFTHSICPDCARRLYPEFYDK